MVSPVLLLHGAVIAIFAILYSWAAASFADMFSVVVAFGLCWICVSVRHVAAHGHRVLVRTLGSNSSRLEEGAFFVSLPDYVVSDRAQYGTWRGFGKLPLVGDVRSIDVPAALISIENGLYCLKVNTKVVGVVEAYTAEDLMRDSTAIEQRFHDAIAQALRGAVHDKPLEDAMAEIHRIFLKDPLNISQLLSVPTFRPTQLMLDPEEHVQPADTATKQALELILQRKEESAKRSHIEAAMVTEEHRVKLRRIEVEAGKSQMMLHQEVYGREGAALIEAAKHAKAFYFFSGGAQGAAAPTTIFASPP